MGKHANKDLEFIQENFMFLPLPISNSDEINEYIDELKKEIKKQLQTK